MPQNRRRKRPGRNPRNVKKRPPKARAKPKAKAAAKTPAAEDGTAASTPPTRSRRPRRAHGGHGPSREIVGIVGLGTAIFVLAALLSLQIGSGLLMGPLGRTIATVVYGFAGLCSYILVGLLVLISIRLLTEKLPILRWHETSGLALGLASLATLVHLIGADYRVAGYAPGGFVGEHIAEVLRAIISTAGTALLAVIGLVITAVISTPLRMRQIGGYLGRGARFCWAGIAQAGAATGHFCGEVIRAVLPEREHDEYLDEEYDDEEYDDEAYDSDFTGEVTDPSVFDPPIIEGGSAVELSAVPELAMDSDTEKVDQSVLAEQLAREIAEEAATLPPAAAVAEAVEIVIEPVTPEVAAQAATAAAAPAQAAAKPGEKTSKKASKKASKKKPAAVIVEEVAGAPAPAAAPAAPVEDEPSGPMIVESEFMNAGKPDMLAKEQAADAERLPFISLGDKKYELPPIHLLDYDESQRASIDRSAMLELSAKLTRTLENYGVKGEVVAIRPGPVVTMYEFSPAPGIRINKITNLADDLAMALEALRVRIVAPIPGKAAVGIEVPNKSRETVYFKEIIADETFQQAKYKLPLALGKNIEGAPQVVNLAKMPHLLVAGTTGSGKSVSVNSMITSLLYRCSPEDVRMIMVDPKMLELSIYEGVPHLLLPVVTDPKKANLALRWSVEEMERRYELLAKMGVRDLVSYNKKAAKQRARYEAEKLRMAAEEAMRMADADEFVEITEEREAPLPSMDAPAEHLPYIVIIIDEFADLMMCAPKEVETSVARIAQKARAAGIHMILATQRPSVDVITGLIKANFPSRAAFRVASKVDSRTVLDQGGAEALLGSGDMLFSDRGASPVRLHGCFVDEEEISRVVDFLKVQSKPEYNMDIIKPREDDGDGSGTGSSKGSSVDAMYDQAVAVVSEARNVSISMLQRRLRIGYNRAARIVEEMERQGVVSPPDHTNKREVLISEIAA